MRDASSAHAARITIEYGLDIEDELAQIIPPELRGEIDDGHDGC